MEKNRRILFDRPKPTVEEEEEEEEPNSKDHYKVLTSTLLYLISHLFNAHFNIVFISMLTSTKFFFAFRFFRLSDWK
jgi:hypothetical protein